MALRPITGENGVEAAHAQYPWPNVQLERQHRQLIDRVKLAEVEALRVHGLRHTASALMLSSGMPITMVSRQLGHSSTSTTDLIYGGLLRESLDTAVETFGDWYESQV